MNDKEHDRGVIMVLMERLEKQRLPRARELKAKVDAGECLNNLDMEFIQEVIQSSGDVEGLLKRHPEYGDIAARALNLYNEIMDKALQNEKAS